MVETNEKLQEFAEKLAKAGREGVAWEIKKLEWLREQKKVGSSAEQKA